MRTIMELAELVDWDEPADDSPIAYWLRDIERAAKRAADPIALEFDLEMLTLEHFTTTEQVWAAHRVLRRPDEPPYALYDALAAMDETDSDPRGARTRGRFVGLVVAARMLVEGLSEPAL